MRESSNRAIGACRHLPPIYGGLSGRADRGGISIDMHSDKAAGRIVRLHEFCVIYGWSPAANVGATFGRTTGAGSNGCGMPSAISDRQSGIRCLSSRKRSVLFATLIRWMPPSSAGKTGCNDRRARIGRHARPLQKSTDWIWLPRRHGCGASAANIATACFIGKRQRA